MRERDDSTCGGCRLELNACFITVSDRCLHRIPPPPAWSYCRELTEPLSLQGEHDHAKVSKVSQNVVYSFLFIGPQKLFVSGTINLYHSCGTVLIFCCNIIPSDFCLMSDSILGFGESLRVERGHLPQDPHWNCQSEMFGLLQFINCLQRCVLRCNHWSLGPLRVLLTWQ